jgi:hypothetical protein
MASKYCKITLKKTRGEASIIEDVAAKKNG